MYSYNLGISFQNIAEKYPDNSAIKFETDQQVTYAALNSQANRVARHFLESGVAQKDVVGITGHKTFNTFAGMLACLKIGAIYTILDPNSPVKRLEKIVVTCPPKLLFCHHRFDRSFQTVARRWGLSAVNYEQASLDEIVQNQPATNLLETENVTGANPAYIMFTSGSTGFPKGVVISHSNVLNFIRWSVNTYKISADDILTNVNPLYFDNSVFDFYSSLFSGAALAPFPKEIVTNPKRLLEMIDALTCTSWFSVPSLLIFLSTMKALNPDTMKSIRRFIFGGEGYPKSKLKQLYDLYSDRAQIFNVYGPSECTCICSSYEITASDFDDLQGFPPLGRLAPNFSGLILTETGRRVPAGEIGELCLLGPNVGSGYYNDLERTGQVFVQNPENDCYPEIMYKTGDLVKYNPEDGKIHIVGRRDNQIKHMGYRIELEEIETALSCVPHVSQAIAIHRQQRGLSQIVAVVASTQPLKEGELRQNLKAFIPDYMIPSAFFFETELPKNQNGKVDRVKIAERYI